MKFLKRLITFIVVIAICFFLFRMFKPKIAECLMRKGISVPGITDDVGLFPTSETITDADGNVSVVVNLPATYTTEFSQEQLDELMRQSDGRLVAVKHDDGTATFTISEEYRDELLGQISDGFDDSVLATLTTGNVRYISHNEDYSVFTVVCDPAISESEILTLTGKLFAVGKLYASFAGHDEVTVRVDVITSEDGSVSNSYTSDNIAAGIATDAQNWAGDLFDNTVSNVMDGLGVNI